MRRLEVADLSLATLDALDVDALLVLVGPERPLQGLAGLVDWRTCGALSRALLGGLYAGAPDEALLLPTGGRLPAPRVVAVGLPALGAGAGASGQGLEAFTAAVRRAFEVLVKAGATSFATALPGPEVADQATLARCWLEAVEGAPRVRQVLLGEARTLLAELGAARAAAGAAVEIAPFTARPGAVVR